MGLPQHDAEQLVEQVVGLKRMLGQFGRLIEISLTLNTTVDQEELLNFIIDTGTEILDCDAISIMLYNEIEHELRFAASSGANPEELANIPVPLDASIAGTIFTENRPEVINNVAADPRHFKNVGKETETLTRNLVGVPMRIQDKITGVMEAINKHDGDFTQEDRDILMVIASQAAVAINNANLMGSLQSANTQLSNIDKIKNDFMAIASHELRTPLGVLLGYATILQEDASGGELGSHANKVLNSALKLRSLVEDLTNMTMLELGEEELLLNRVPIQQIVANAYTEVQSTLETKKHTPHIHLPKEPIYVMADAGKLEKAVTNLLNNAIQFTPIGGQIVINVSKDDKYAQVSITDSGAGIPPHELENIFDDFYQVEGHMTRSIGGMGLGLPIARGLIELHGGRIWAESEGEDMGATFNFTLPVTD
jgi:signal transduction histidine kinase